MTVALLKEVKLAFIMIPWYQRYWFFVHCFPPQNTCSFHFLSTEELLITDEMDYITLCYFFWKAKAIFASIDFETQWSIFFVRLYSGIYLKLFPGVCCNRWQGWTWIETWKSLANFFKFQHSCYSLNSMPEEVTNWKKMSWLVLPDEVVCYLHHNNNQLSLIKIPSKKLL